MRVVRVEPLRAVAIAVVEPDVQHVAAEVRRVILGMRAPNAERHEVAVAVNDDPRPDLIERRLRRDVLRVALHESHALV